MPESHDFPEIFFRDLFFHSPVPLCLCAAADARVVEANESFLGWLGYSRAELIGSTDCIQRLCTDAKAGAEATQAIRAGDVIRDCEWRLKSKSGDTRTTLVSAAPIHYKGQSVCLLSCHDLTDRLKREVHLRQSQKMEAVGQLAAGFAHDFNNILAIIQGYASLLQAEPSRDALCQKGLKEISIAAERAAQLTRQLLTFSRKQVMQLKSVDLNTIVEGLATVVQRLFGEGITLKCQLTVPAPCLRADTGMLEQLILNLAAN